MDQNDRLVVKQLLVRVSADLRDNLREEAKRERRSMSAQLNYILSERYEKPVLVDTGLIREEMEGLVEGAVNPVIAENQREEFGYVEMEDLSPRKKSEKKAGSMTLKYCKNCIQDVGVRGFVGGKCRSCGRGEK